MKRCPSVSEFQKGCRAFQRHERRDAMYQVARFLVEHHWGNAAEVADGLGVLLLTWNQAFFRFGSFNFQHLEDCIARNQDSLAGFRRRDVFSFANGDRPEVTRLFDDFLCTLQICEGQRKGAKSPVAVGKALHVVAPGFFPLWDRAIAIAYECGYDARPASSYLRFVSIMKGCAEQLQETFAKLAPGKTMLKRLDEYNYAKYTKRWI